MASKNMKIEYLPISALRIDQQAQRPLNEARAAAIAADLDVDAFGVLQVSHNGTGSTYYVIDGQHRMEAARLAWGDKEQVPCHVHEGVNRTRRAELFIKANNTKKPQHIDRFKVAVTAKNPESVAISDIVGRFGLVIDGGPHDGHISCTAALENVYRGARLTGQEANPEALAKTLAILAGTWGNQHDAYAGVLVHGIGFAVLKYANALVAPDLVKRLQKTQGPNALIGRARQLRDAEGGTLPTNVADAIVRIYNAGRRTSKLPGFRAQ